MRINNLTSWERGARTFIVGFAQSGLFDVIDPETGEVLAEDFPDAATAANHFTTALGGTYTEAPAAIEAEIARARQAAERALAEAEELDRELERRRRGRFSVVGGGNGEVQ